MDFCYNCVAKLCFDSEEMAENAAKAVLPELASGHARRSIAKIKVNKDVLSLNIKALDAVALRASLNSYLKLIELVEKISEVE